MKKVFLIIFMLIGTLGYSQIKISDFYFGIGYHFTKVDDFDNFTNELIGSDFGFPLDSFPQFESLNGFMDIGLGSILSFGKIQKFELDLSIDYLFHKKQKEDYETFKVYQGMTINEDLTYNYDGIGREIYEYSYQIKNLVLGITPEYEIISKEKLKVSAGIGLLGVYSLLSQKGVDVYSNMIEMITNAGIENSSKVTLGWQAGLSFNLKLTDRSFIDFNTKYKSWKLNEFGPSSFKETGMPNNSTTSFYPITKTTIDLSGLNLQIRYKYRF